LSLEGRATIEGREVVRPVVPADDRMQAFFYRHLVPAQELRVAVSGQKMARGAVTILGDLPLRIPTGGAATVRVAAPSRSFAGAMQLAVLLGIIASVGGVATSFYAETPSGGTIVLLALALYLVAQVGARWRPASRHGTRAERHTHEHGPGCGHEAIPHGDHVDYLHDGHRHAPHDDHYDEHAEDHRHDPEHEYGQRRVR